MNADNLPIPMIIPKREAPVIRAFGDEMIVKLDGATTNGKLTLWSHTTPPGGGPPPHYHRYEDELFMVQEGTASFFLDGIWSEVGPGGVVFAPRGSVHTFRNNTAKPIRMTVMTQPSGFETFFARCAEEFRRSKGPDMARIAEISAEHGIYHMIDIVHPAQAA